jgi:hypothetical protein
MSGEIVYPLGELEHDNWYRSGNYIQPDNYRIPDFCEGCPLAEGLCEPRISRIRQGMVPVNEGNVRHIGSFSDYRAGVLVLGDTADSGFEPVFLGEVPLVSPFSVQHESGESQALGEANRKVDSCDGPAEGRRLLRVSQVACGSGFVKVAEYSRTGWRLHVPQEIIADPSNQVVGADTSARMNEYRRSIAARRAAGQVLQDRPVDLQSIQNLMDAALLLTRPE